MPSVIQMLRGILPAQRRRVTLHGLVIIRFYRSPWLVRSEAKDLCFCDVILREVKDLCNLFVSDSQDANKKAQAVRRRRL
jgi:hypothetical protein